MTSARLRRLPRRHVGGLLVPVATGFRSRLLGLAGLSPASAGAGLLIPDCASVHTLGMRFHLDLVFLDRRGEPLAVRRAVPPARLVRCPGAEAVLEVPSSRGESFPGAGT
jgi:uncharacterized protein